MGVVFGNINFIDETYNYQFFKDYCLAKKIVFEDGPEDKFISTFNIPDLQIKNPSTETEIKGLSSYIEGMDKYGFEINVVGIAYPFYGEEFPHHVDFYNNMF